MTSKQAIKAAQNSLTSEDLQRFKMTKREWDYQVKWLEAIGIYPDIDPRTKL